MSARDIAIITLSFLLSLVFVALVLRLARVKSWYDRTDVRKIHSGNVPRLGGMGFSLAFIIAATVTGFRSPDGGGYGIRFLPVIAAMLLVLCLGVLDDFRPLPPKKKLLGQIAAALLVVLPGYTFRRLFFFDIGGFGVLEWWLRYPLTVFWIVGMTNALNFIDGVDGLSGGVSLLISLAYGIIFSRFSGPGPAPLLCFCLAAVLLGFLVFNLPLPKARIFMGDGGALFLGFVLAVLPLVDRGNAMPLLPLFSVAALLLIPILDLVAAFWRRIRDRHPIDMPDRSHVHHKLMNLGFRAGQIDCLLWTLQIFLCVLVYLSILTPGWKSLLFLVLAVVLAAAFFCAVHFLNRRNKPQGA